MNRHYDLMSSYSIGNLDKTIIDNGIVLTHSYL